MEWIKVKDKTPSNTNRIITWDGMFVQEGYYSFIEKRVVVPSFKHHNEVTHWMPLPEPPKE